LIRGRAERRALVERKDPALPVSQQCRLLAVSRSSVYRRPAEVSEEDRAIMALIDRQYLARPYYGSRRMAAWLTIQGHLVNRKRPMESVISNQGALKSTKSTETDDAPKKIGRSPRRDCVVSSGSGQGGGYSMVEDRFLKRLRKKARKGLQGWPIATVAFYGPNLSQATKVAVGIVPSENAEAEELRDWKVDRGDIAPIQTLPAKCLIEPIAAAR
jgi:hypothetical protein